MASTAETPETTETPAEPTFSLALTQEQKDLRDWVHGFAEGVVRPAAHEWDEREETPWPIIQEAAKIGLYGFESLQQFAADPSGLTMPIVQEELFWGDAGIGMAIMGTGLAAAAIAGQGTWRAGHGVDPALLRHGRRHQGRRLLRLGAQRRLRRLQHPHDAPSTTRPPTPGSLNGQKAWATNGGIADVHVVIAQIDRELGSRGHAAFVVPIDDRGHRAGRQGQEARPARVAHRRRPPRRLPHPRRLPARRQGEARRAPRPRPRGQEGQDAGRDADLRGHAARSSAPRRWASPAPPTSTRLDYAKEREQFGKKIIENQSIAFALANMKMELDAARLLVWRASWMARNGIPFENAEGSMSKLKAGEVAVWATERAIQIMGGNGYTREFPVERWHRDSKIYTIFEGTSEMQQLVIARAISGMRIS